jgi:type I restriction-modification system DNA methylase subunit
MTEKTYTKQTFISLFNSIARHKHRYSVFTDFVFMASIAIHNALPFCRSEALEKEYMEIVGRYSKAEAEGLGDLLGNLIVLLDTEPRDILGSLYMELELENTNNGQFFSPHEISLLMAKITLGDVLDTMQSSSKPFITLSEPACGAGGMVLAFVNEMRKRGVNPAEKLFAQCIDIDRLAGFMCYLQLSLWHIPAQIIIGDTLAMEWREIYYTPAYYLGEWETRLRVRQFMEIFDSIAEPKESEPASNKPHNAAPATVEMNTHTKKQKTKIQSPTNGFQQADLFSFDFQIDH